MWLIDVNKLPGAMRLAVHKNDSLTTHFILFDICKIQESVLAKHVIRSTSLILSLHRAVRQLSWFPVGFPFILLALVHDKVACHNQAVPVEDKWSS